MPAFARERRRTARACALATGIAFLLEPAAAFASGAEEACPIYLRQRCEQLVAYYDYYGVSRKQNSDGRRNHTRIKAAIECQRGDCLAGINRMLVLMRNKAMVPPLVGARFSEPEDE